MLRSHRCVSRTLLAARPLLIAGRQGHHGKRSARVSQVVLAVAEERAREPAAAFALVGFQPRDPSLKRSLVSGNARAAKHVNREAGAVAVAGVEVLRQVLV